MCIRDRLGDPAEGQGQGKGVTTTAGNSSADSGGSRVAEEKQVDIFAFQDVYKRQIQKGMEMGG